MEGQLQAGSQVWARKAGLLRLHYSLFVLRADLFTISETFRVLPGRSFGGTFVLFGIAHIL